MSYSDLWLYIGLGFIAQLVDGALGMAYGLISTSALLATGAPPAIASASVHTAEIVTTGLAGASHVWNRNVDWSLFKRLAPAGIVGGVLGAYVLTSLPDMVVKVFVTVYLLGIALVIARRLFIKAKDYRNVIGVVPIGAGGGFLDAVGGGGWGPLVTSTLIARGDSPRHSIGSVSLAEFLVTIAVSATFIAALDFGRYSSIVLGLVIGGALAAPLAGYLARILPQRLLMGIVAILVGILGVYNLTRIAS